MQISIAFDPAVDRRQDIALSVARAFGLDTIDDLLAPSEEDDGEAAEEAAAPPATATNPKGWTNSKMRRYVAELAPTALKVLRAIAEGAPEVGIEQVQAAAGLEAYQYAGSMSSFGFAARNTHGVKEKPFVKVDKIYQMDPAVAQIALTALTEGGF